LVFKRIQFSEFQEKLRVIIGRQLEPLTKGDKLLRDEKTSSDVATFMLLPKTNKRGVTYFQALEKIF
jgi:hypothetical protein